MVYQIGGGEVAGVVTGGGVFAGTIDVPELFAPLLLLLDPELHIT